MASQDEGSFQMSQTVSTSASNKSTPQNPTPPRFQSSSRVAFASIETPDISTPATSVTQLHRSQTPLTPAFRKPESPRSGGGEPSPAKAAKIAIPRLKRTAEASASTDGRIGGTHRVNHACEPCRQRKTKCSGERPICRHCQDFKIQCHYADGKRDRVKKQFGSMTEKVADYEKLLRGLSLRIGGDDADLIRSILERDAGYTDVDGSVSQEPASTVDEESASVNSADESDASASAGSTGALDRTEEDFTRPEAKDTGFMGKNSELTWMQRLRQENKYGSPPRESADPEVRRNEKIASKQNTRSPSAPPPPHEDGFTIQDSSYFLDNESVTVPNPDAVDAYEMPTREMANTLFDAYMTRVHPSFPIVGKSALSSQYYKFVLGQLKQPPAKWLAIINMIFAIGAKYLQLTQVQRQPDDNDHLIYFVRARMLGMNGNSLFEHPDLQQIQIAGLMSFYLVCISRPNRAWVMAGLAIRAAAAMGLYMRNESSQADSLKEIRYRVWWSLYTLEHKLCSMTGRVNSIVEDHVTTPLPVPFEENDFESEAASGLLKMDKQQGERNPSTSRSPSVLSPTPSTERSKSLTKPDFSRTPSTEHSELAWARNVPPNSALYFLHWVQLTRLTQGIFHRLYTPGAVQGSWEDIQNIIKDLQEHLERWYKELPVAFDFKRKQRDRDFYEHRLCLGFFYYGTTISINRPTLCRLDRKMPNQSKESSDFNSNAAARCLEAAIEMMALIPDEPNAVDLNRVGPFWNLLHWMMKASTVLMLELSFRAYHMPQEAENILEAAQKAVRWIHNMGEHDRSAAKAWRFCNAMLRDSAKKIGRDVTDLPEQPPGRYQSMSQPRSEGSHMSYQRPVQPPQPEYSAAPIFNPLQFSEFDNLMQHDQYFPRDPTIQMPFQYTEPSVEELDFMSREYHSGQDL